MDRWKFLLVTEIFCSFFKLWSWECFRNGWNFTLWIEYVSRMDGELWIFFCSWNPKTDPSRNQQNPNLFSIARLLHLGLCRCLRAPGGLCSLKSRGRERERRKYEDASMSATLLEQTRAAHEEVERLEKCVVQELQRDTKSHKERLHQNHRVNNMLLASLASTAKLVCSRVSFCRFFLPFWSGSHQGNAVRRLLMSKKQWLYASGLLKI